MSSSRLDSLEAIVASARLRLQEENVANDILQEALRNRPKSTKKAFVKKQEEFINWARGKEYNPPEFVTQHKLVLFLYEEVIGRGNRNCSGKKIGKPTVLQYISAITSLWKFQRDQGLNVMDNNPRGELTKGLLKNLDKQLHAERKQSYFDRGRLYQHLLSTEMRRNRKLVSDFFWKDGSRNVNSAFRGLRNRLGYLLSEQGLIRGENVRDLELPDFFSITYENEGPKECNAMVIIKGRGKTNQYGKPLFSGYYRHKDVTLCAVSSAAFFLFLRYHICNEPFPDLSSPEGWYDIVMFCSYVTSNTKAFSASGHALAICNAHDKLQIISPKVTHGGRLYGRQKLEDVGVEKVAQDVAGGWSVSAGEGCYGNGLSKPSMRAMAGFPHDQAMYNLPRASLCPPRELLDMVFPSVDEWIERHRTGLDCEKNFALDGFLRLLSWFKVVVLQDAAVMIDDFHHEVLFNHAIFHTQEFIQFKDALQQHMEISANPIEEQIQRVLPQLCVQMQSNNIALKDHIVNAINASSQHLTQQILGTQQHVQHSMHSLRSAITTSLINAINTFNDMHSLDDGSLGEANNNMGSIDDVSDSLIPPQMEQIPPFEQILSPSVNTVPEVLMEWEVGKSGIPSISDAETTWQTKWRVGSQQQKAFSRRKMVYQLITRYASKRSIAHEEAALFIEEKRLHKNYSLRILADKWKSFESEFL